MITSVDTSVLIDVLSNQPDFAARSEAALRTARREGRLIVCEAVVAELSPVLPTQQELMEFLGDVGLDFVPSPLEVAVQAGTTYSRYLKNRGGAARVLPDFLIAAHAQHLADRLLTRDRGYYRTYFEGLVLLAP